MKYLIVVVLSLALFCSCGAKNLAILDTLPEPCKDGYIYNCTKCHSSNFDDVS